VRQNAERFGVTVTRLVSPFFATKIVQFKNVRQHQEKTTLPPFALVVLPTHLTNELTKKTVCATTSAN
jgi:hypothetical protein